MTIVVIGGGAIGLLVAGRLAHAGEPVALIARESTRRAIMEKGLTLISKGGERTSIRSFTVATTPEALPSDYYAPALAILCVKGYATASSLPTIHALNPNAVLTLQNGIGNEEALAADLGEERVLSGAITSSVEPEDPATMIVTKTGGIGLAPMVKSQDLSIAITPLERAGFTLRTYPDHQTLKWSKVLLNMLGNGTAAILDMPVSEIYADKRLFALEQRMFLEARSIMRRIGAHAVDLPSYPVVLLSRAMRWFPLPILQPIMQRMIAGGRGGKAPSLLRDMYAQRKESEGAAIYGAIAARAASSGLAAPCNAGVWRLLESIVKGDQPWETYRRNPARLLKDIGC